MTRFIQDSPIKLPDDTAERVRRIHASQIAELQKTPAAGLVVIADVQLADGVLTQVAHGLGQAPKWVGVSAVRGATSTGRIVESLSADPAKYVSLTATGHGATITVNLAVI